LAATDQKNKPTSQRAPTVLTALLAGLSCLLVLAGATAAVRATQPDAQQPAAQQPAAQQPATAQPAGAGTEGDKAAGTPAAAALSIKVQGKQLIDGSGHAVQLRGVNVSGLEFVPIQGWSPANPWGGQTGDDTPNWSLIASWKTNVVRLPLNQASWLGKPCVRPGPGQKKLNPDPGGNYRQTVARSVQQANAAGLYVILDLQWTAPANLCPEEMNSAPDMDNSPAFWVSVATQFKDNPAVLFDLYNESWTFPREDWTAGGDAWAFWRDGGTLTQYAPGPHIYKYKAAGMQALVDAVRSTGATNVLVVGGMQWASDLSGWVSHRPKDPLNQMAAAWHAYPKAPGSGGSDASVPTGGTEQYRHAEGILAAGVPVIIGEIGDHSAPGTAGAPFLAQMLPWADAHNVSYLGWTWDPWGGTDNVLIKDAAGTPSDGFGQYFRQHLLCRAAANCKR